MKRTIQVAMVGALLSFGAGCGPIVSGMKILRADVDLSEAETAGAKVSALYEHTAATEYLAKAREEHAYSEFWTARRYADKAIGYADKAREISEAASEIEQQDSLSSEPQ